MKLRVEIWSDIACPWCHVGKRRLEAALAQFPHREDVEIVWRAFELDPRAPRVRTSEQSYAERIANKYGTTPERAQRMVDDMTRVAAEDGLDFHFERVKPGNTFDAHRLLHLAGEKGAAVQDAVKERFLRAYLSEGEAIGDPETLARLAGEAGLAADEVRRVLDGDVHAEEVRRDEAEAHAFGIQGVPFFAIGRYGVSGAQPAEVLLRVLTQAWKEQEAEGEGEAEAPFAEGAACGPDGCA